ncbi:MAG: secondary thiamine-phosphate synthase enzyme YjbQ [Planctomycetota bacterium]
MPWRQQVTRLSPRRRGFHLVTAELLAAMPAIEATSIGLLHLFLQHTSASLTINENADPDVRPDLEMAINHVAPESLPYTHTCEGPDDMPAHVKASLIGAGLTIPIADGRLMLGTWQGVYLCEHRNHAGPRQVVLTLWGEDG